MRPKKKDVYTWITESLYCSTEINTILSINSNKKKKIKKKKGDNSTPIRRGKKKNDVLMSTTQGRTWGAGRPESESSFHHLLPGGQRAKLSSLSLFISKMGSALSPLSHRVSVSRKIETRGHMRKSSLGHRGLKEILPLHNVALSGKHPPHFGLVPNFLSIKNLTPFLLCDKTYLPVLYL